MQLTLDLDKDALKCLMCLIFAKQSWIAILNTCRKSPVSVPSYITSALKVSSNKKCFVNIDLMRHAFYFVWSCLKMNHALDVCYGKLEPSAKNWSVGCNQNEEIPMKLKSIELQHQSIRSINRKKPLPKKIKAIFGLNFFQVKILLFFGRIHIIFVGLSAIRTQSNGRTKRRRRRPDSFSSVFLHW